MRDWNLRGVGLLLLWGVAEASFPMVTDAADKSKKGALRSPPIERIGEGQYRVGRVRLDQEAREIAVPARLHLDTEPLEYALVHERGKTHESLLLTEVAPYHVHLAALLLGAPEAVDRTPDKEEKPASTASKGSGEGGEDEANKKSQPPTAGQIRDPTAVDLPGKPIAIRVAWEPVSGEVETEGGDGPRTDKNADKEGSMREVPLSAWIRNVEADGGMAEEGWIYNSSQFLYGHFMAERVGSIIAIIADPNALMNSKSPSRTNDEIWRPYTERLPPLKTEVWVKVRFEETDKGEE